MIKSMTGFGKSSIELAGNKITIEIKSLNCKQTELNLRISGKYKAKEAEIRSELAKMLERGKIDFFLTVENTNGTNNNSVNKVLVHKYFEDIELLAKELNQPVPSDIISLILRMPDVFSTENKDVEEDEWNFVLAAIKETIEKLNIFRIQEGEILEKDINNRIYLISKLLTSIDKYEIERINTIKTRINKNLSDLFSKETIDRNRFEQELIYYLEKIDITEEKVRLKKHCEYFAETISDKDSNGKKLGFITQEIGREINTIGSKANDVSIQKIVVQMKDELEKVKEQLLNIL